MMEESATLGDVRHAIAQLRLPVPRPFGFVVGVAGA